MQSVEKTIISQYATSPTIVALVRYMDGYIDPRANIDDFFDRVFNIETAVGFGLDIWGRIVGVSRELKIPTEDSYFGFREAAPDGILDGLSLDFTSQSYSYIYISIDSSTQARPFGESPFRSSTATATTQTYRLADDAYRKLILLKALANICDCSIPSINQLLSNYFAGRGRCYVSDIGAMRMRYTFEFELTPVEFAVITQSGVIPRPTGVSATLLYSPLPLFGFAEAGESAAPFGVGVFVPSSANAAI